MKRHPILRVLAGISLLLLGFGGCTRKESGGPRVRVLAYSSLGASGGYLSGVVDEFRASSGCALEIETTLGAAEMISTLHDPRRSEGIDLVMGIDEILFQRISDRIVTPSLPEPEWKPRVLPVLLPRLKPGFIPLDFGALSLIYRKSDFKDPGSLPHSRKDLFLPRMKGKFILQDPRASSPGMMFFLFLAGEGSPGKLRKQWLTLAPSWDASYKMFLAGDAPMVWSYLSSLAYHASKNQLEEYGSVEFEEGLPVQLEGMGVLKQESGKPINPCTEKWLHFVLDPRSLERLSAKQWMKPAYSGVKDPPFFDRVPALKKIAPMDLSVSAVDRLLSGFGRDLQGESF